jgi:hypothetical protein
VGRDTYFPALVTAVENSLRGKFKSEKPLSGRLVAVVGTNPLAKRLALQMKAAGCGVIIVSYDKVAAHELAQEVGCRMLQMEALYTTMHDVVLVADEERVQAKSRAGLSAVGMRNGVTLLDLTDPLKATPLAAACAGRGLTVILPRDIWLARVQLHAETLAGKPVPRDVLAGAVPWLMDAK